MILTLPLLADRWYLHGTTLFDALLPEVPLGSAVSLKISRIIESDRVEIAPVSVGCSASAFFSWRGPQGEASELAIMPRSATMSPRREPYDENAITEAARSELGDRRVRFDGPSPFSFIATLIPLNKVLLGAHMRPRGEGGWLFTRIDLTRVPEHFLPLVLDYDGALARGTLARSRISAAGQLVGLLYFSWSMARMSR